MILDDSEDRRLAMAVVLSRFGEKALFFDNAPDMCAWLADNLANVTLLSLDHDLGLNHVRDGEVFDPGTGMHVAEFLAEQEPVCPVIIHTSNYIARAGMDWELRRWPLARAASYGATWIEEEWAPVVESFLEKSSAM